MPDTGVKGLLVRNPEHLRPGQLAKVMDTLTAGRHGQETAAAWTGKEKPRDALNLRARITRSAPCERAVRDRLSSFYDWRARNDDIPELLTPAKTIAKRENQILAAALAGVTNARSQALNQLARPEARMAYSFPNPASQRRRVRVARTRTTRRTRAITPRRSHQATGLGGPWSLPQAGRAVRPPGRAAVRRRAADGQDRAHAAGPAHVLLLDEPTERAAARRCDARHSARFGDSACERRAFPAV